MAGQITAPSSLGRPPFDVWAFVIPHSDADELLMAMSLLNTAEEEDRLDGRACETPDPQTPSVFEGPPFIRVPHKRQRFRMCNVWACTRRAHQEAAICLQATHLGAHKSNKVTVISKSKRSTRLLKMILHFGSADRGEVADGPPVLTLRVSYFPNSLSPSSSDAVMSELLILINISTRYSELVNQLRVLPRTTATRLVSFSSSGRVSTESALNTGSLFNGKCCSMHSIFRVGGRKISCIRNHRRHRHHQQLRICCLVNKRRVLGGSK